MQIAPFYTEQYYARYEFTTPYMLSASDCETISVGELLALAGQSPADLAALRLQYTESQGDPQLRAMIAATYENTRADDIVMLGAPEEGIFITMHALLEAGDEVIVLTPAYDSLYNLAQHVSGAAIKWPLRPLNPADGTPGWALDLDALEALIGPRTRLVVVNFPHNPTGYLPTAAEFDALLALTEQHNVWLFCDEIYRGLELHGRPALPSAPDRSARALALGGLSKSYGLPGLRTGWLVVRDAALRDKLINWKHYTTICPPAPSEWLAKAALGARTTLISRSRQLIEANLALAKPFFERWSDFMTLRLPQAGSIALAEVAVESAADYCEWLARDAGVLLLPGRFLNAPDYTVRFGFGRAGFGEALAVYDGYLQRTTAT